MLASFSVLELVFYAIFLAIVGGIPGFYFFASIRRNPRQGARYGVILGVLIGFLGALANIIVDLRGIINIITLSWLLMIVASLIMNATGSGLGSHLQTVTLRQSMADMAYGLLLPTLIIVMGIVVFPMIWNLILAFRPVRLRDLQQISMFSLDNLTLSNFDRVLGARDFGNILVRTLIYTVSGTLLAILMGLSAALIVKDKFPGRNIVRGFMLFPYIAPIVSVVLIWQIMLNAQFGIINRWIQALGGRPISFLTTPGWAFLTIILFQAWRYFPFAFLFLLARIQAIPEDIYEAAKVDGAAPSQRLWYVTLPQLRAVFGTLFLLRFIWTFNKFDDVFLLTGGAANTKVITVEVYDQLFSRSNVGTASAVAIVLAVILFIIVGVYFRWFMVEES